jgi:hypothetical protein
MLKVAYSEILLLDLLFVKHSSSQKYDKLFLWAVSHDPPLTAVDSRLTGIVGRTLKGAVRADQEFRGFHTPFEGSEFHYMQPVVNQNIFNGFLNRLFDEIDDKLRSVSGRAALYVLPISRAAEFSPKFSIIRRIISTISSRLNADWS